MKKTAAIMLLLILSSFTAADEPWDVWADNYDPGYTDSQVSNPSYALGPVDGSYASIPMLRKITLDMGVGEEIVNGDGYDFVVYEADPGLTQETCIGPDAIWMPESQECVSWRCTRRIFGVCVRRVCNEYDLAPAYCRVNVDCETVSVAVDNPSEPMMQWMDMTCDAQGYFDLGDPMMGAAMEKAQYVRVMNLMGDPIELDAVEALHQATPQQGAPEFASLLAPLFILLTAPSAAYLIVRKKE